MKKLIKTVAMVSVIFLFTGCNPVDKILESEKFKNLVDGKIKSEIDVQLNNISQNKEIEELKLKIGTLESKIGMLEELVKTQEKQQRQFKNMMN